MSRYLCFHVYLLYHYIHVHVQLYLYNHVYHEFANSPTCTLAFDSCASLVLS